MRMPARTAGLFLWRLLLPLFAAAALLCFVHGSASAGSTVYRYVKISSDWIDAGNGYQVYFYAQRYMDSSTGSVSVYIQKSKPATPPTRT
jgi:hypothetical protein